MSGCDSVCCKIDKLIEERRLNYFYIFELIEPLKIEYFKRKTKDLNSHIILYEIKIRKLYDDTPDNFLLKCLRPNMCGISDAFHLASTQIWSQTQVQLEVIQNVFLQRI